MACKAPSGRRSFRAHTPPHPTQPVHLQSAAAPAQPSPPQRKGPPITSALAPMPVTRRQAAASAGAEAREGAGGAARAAAIAAVASAAPSHRRRPRTAAQRASHAQLLPWELAPEHMRDNTYILRHYRGVWPFRKSLSSLFWLHNETGNIWTHLIGEWGGRGARVGARWARVWGAAAGLELQRSPSRLRSPPPPPPPPHTHTHHHHTHRLPHLPAAHLCHAAPQASAAGARGPRGGGGAAGGGCGGAPLHGGLAGGSRGLGGSVSAGALGRGHVRCGHMRVCVRA